LAIRCKTLNFQTTVQDSSRTAFGLCRAARFTGRLPSLVPTSPELPACRSRAPQPITCTAAIAGAASFSYDDVENDGRTAPSLTVIRQSRRFPTWLAAVRAAFFYLTTFVFAAPLFFIMLAVYPAVMVFDKFRRRAEHAINTVWAKLTTLLYYPVKIVGLDNLPAYDQPAVYVSNHQSFLDIYTLFHLHRDFKFISKTSNFLIPIIGWSMFLTGHVMINRVDRRSQLECLKACGELLKRGASVLFFPEGTRSKDGKMHAFKKGAFSVAAKAKVPVVPITLKGTGDLMPNAREYLLYPGRVEVVIHPPVPPSDADSMMNAAFTAIASSLPPEMVTGE
jgi:1-acyl-sn-glycerol-3-phosphate acyltransferase